MLIEELREAVQQGVKALRITSHAQVEAFKDGLRLADLRLVFEMGQVIEAYPEENRVLLYTDLPDGIPVHIVVQETSQQAVIITAYVPDRRQWIKERKRR